MLWFKCPCRKYKVVQACYNLVYKVNHNLVAALSQIYTTLLLHCNNLGIETVTRLWQPCHKVVTRLLQSIKSNSIYGMAAVWWMVSSEWDIHT